MRVLFLSPAYPPEKNGIGDYTFQLLGELQRHDVETSVLTRGPLGLPWNSPLTPLMKRKIESFRPDIVHLQYEGFGFHQSFTLPWLWRRLKAKRVLTAHEVWSRTRVHQWRDQHLFRHSHHLIVNDQGCLERLRRLEKNVEISKIGVGMNIPQIPSRFLETNEGPTKIAYFGFFNRIKRVDFLLETLRKLLDEGRRYEVHLIGDFDPARDRYHRELRDLVTKLGLTKNVVFTGALEGAAVSQKLIDCHMAILPFIDGASPRRGSFQAAMGLGLPTITTASDYREPDIKNGETAMVLDHLSPETLKVAITRLAGDRALRQKLREGALAFHGKYDWGRIAKDHLEIYANLLKN